MPIRNENKKYNGSKQNTKKVFQVFDSRSGNLWLLNYIFFDFWEVAIKILILKCVEEGENKEWDTNWKNEFHTCENCGLEYHLSI